jgi:hypothetical protein
MEAIGKPRRPEIDQYTIKFIIGVIALSLPWIELYLTNGSITSISEAFWSDNGPWARNIFVGFLFAIAALMLSYNGVIELEMWLGKFGALCAATVAMFPCDCHPAGSEIIPHLHFASAGTLFAILGVFCVIFFLRANDKKKTFPAAKSRMVIYAICCSGFVLAVVLIIAHLVTGNALLVLYSETVGLTSFGISWLTASRVIPGITDAGERQKLVVST